LNDEFGELAEQSLEFAEFTNFRIGANEFERVGRKVIQSRRRIRSGGGSAQQTLHHPVVP
jgi:hypothetical protein